MWSLVGQQDKKTRILEKFGSKNNKNKNNKNKTNNKKSDNPLTSRRTNVGKKDWVVLYEIEVIYS